MYIYPLEFESQYLNRQALVKNSFFSVILFQSGIIGLGMLDGKVLTLTSKIYLFAFVVMEIVFIVIVFEFMRKPWEGVEIELERALELEQNKILEDEISCMTLENQTK